MRKIIIYPLVYPKINLDKKLDNFPKIEKNIKIAEGAENKLLKQ